MRSRIRWDGVVWRSRATWSTFDRRSASSRRVKGRAFAPTLTGRPGWEGPRCPPVSPDSDSASAAHFSMSSSVNEVPFSSFYVAM